jgi:hypothetical protein
MKHRDHNGALHTAPTNYIAGTYTQPCWTLDRTQTRWNIQQEGHPPRRVACIPVSHSRSPAGQNLDQMEHPAGRTPTKRRVIPVSHSRSPAGQNLDQMEHPAGRAPTKTSGTCQPLKQSCWTEPRPDGTSTAGRTPIKTSGTCQPLTQPCWTEPRPDGTSTAGRTPTKTSGTCQPLTQPCWTEPRPDGTSSRKDTYRDEWYLSATYTATNSLLVAPTESTDQSTWGSRRLRRWGSGVTVDRMV